MGMLDDATFDVAVVDNSTVVFRFDLNANPRLRNMDALAPELNYHLQKHVNARTLTTKYEDDTLFLIVHGTVNPVAFINIDQESQ